VLPAETFNEGFNSKLLKRLSTSASRLASFVDEVNGLGNRPCAKKLIAKANISAAGMYVAGIPHLSRIVGSPFSFELNNLQRKCFD
jgi:hypothetical protein